jgi:hypothetical protein
MGKEKNLLILFLISQIKNLASKIRRNLVVFCQLLMQAHAKGKTEFTDIGTIISGM